MIEFQAWPKTPRYNREVIISEKIDGTNAAIIIEPTEHPVPSEDGIAVVEGLEVGAQSRKRLLQVGADNFGFAAWVQRNAKELVAALGPGRHFGEWWGAGIQRGYAQPKGVKHFSLFNVSRYADVNLEFADGSQVRPVPVLYQGLLSDEVLDMVDLGLRTEGSQAAPGYTNPEGFIIFHSASLQVYKVLLEGDDTHKGALA